MVPEMWFRKEGPEITDEERKFLVKWRDSFEVKKDDSDEWVCV
jgi:hypothetical protein